MCNIFIVLYSILDIKKYKITDCVLYFCMFEIFNIDKKLILSNRKFKASNDNKFVKKKIIFDDRYLILTPEILNTIMKNKKDLKLNLILNNHETEKIFINFCKKYQFEDYYFLDKQINLHDYYVCHKRDILFNTRITFDFHHMNCFQRQGFCKYFTQCQYIKKYYLKNKNSVLISEKFPESDCDMVVYLKYVGNLAKCVVLLGRCDGH